MEFESLALLVASILAALFIAAFVGYVWSRRQDPHGRRFETIFSTVIAVVFGFMAVALVTEICAIILNLWWVPVRSEFLSFEYPMNQIWVVSLVIGVCSSLLAAKIGSRYLKD